MNIFKAQKLSPAQAELVDQGVLHDPIAHLPRKDLLTIQFCKCINYGRLDTAPEWGGLRHESDQNSIEAGYQRFLEDVEGYGAESLPKWLRKKLQGVPWGPDNFCLHSEPAVEFGYPFEPYLTVNGAILSVNQASRILSIKHMDLVRLKLAVLVDWLVVDEAIMRMLKARPLWPRIQLKPGGRGRSYRFGADNGSNANNR